jgi:D-serine deaminase-like pyridoxal phosphate-dependent protein
MRSLIRGSGFTLRPHAKAHKSSGLTAWQLQASTAAGEPTTNFCAQTVGEVAALLKGGCSNVLLTNSLPDFAATRLGELAASHPTATVSALVDCPEHVAALEKGAQAAGVRLGAFVEIECGQKRCGCPAASDTAVRLAKAIVASEVLEWGGLHVYHGAIQHVRSAEERQKEVEAGPAAAARSTVARLEAEGIATPCVTGGGTGTLLQDLAAGTHNECQPGSYLFMDADYAGNEDSAEKGFVQSLYVHTTVVSADVAAGRRVVDAGAKSCDFVCGPPKPTSLTDPALAETLRGVTFKSGGDEHGVLHDVPEGVLPIGSTIALVPSHCDPTVNLHDYLVGVRDGQVETLWEIDARGPG